MRNKLTFLLLFLFFSVSVSVFSQDTLSVNTNEPLQSNPALSFHEKEMSGTVKWLIKKESSKIYSIHSAIEKKTNRSIKKFSRSEKKLKKRILAFDSSAINTIFSYDPMRQMEMYCSKIITNDSLVSLQQLSGQYYPYIDSLQGLFNFIESVSVPGSMPNGVANSIRQMNLLQAKLSSADNLKQVIQQRKEQIKNYLLSKKDVPLSVKKKYNNYAMQAQYYANEADQLKESFNSPDKALKTALAIANKTPAFKQFMQKNSVLAHFFNIPSSGNPSSQTVAGLISREQLIQNVSSITGGRALETIVQQAVQNQQGQSNTNLFDMLGGKDETIVIPNYEPDQQHTKKAGKKFEYGANLQTQRGTSYFPVTTDVAFSIGYKLKNKGVLGVGAAYKIGLGSGINNIKITGEGVGLRSFLDYKIKGNFFITGGFEYNYQQPTIGLPPVYFSNGWAASGLAGVTKTIRLNTKFFKTSKIQVLWDFLGKSQTPQRQQLIFRVGYNL